MNPHASILSLAARIREGGSITDDELRDALQLIRKGRAAAQLASSTKATKRAADKVSGDDLLNLFTK